MFLILCFVFTPLVFAGIPHFESSPSSAGMTGTIRLPNTYSLEPGFVSMGVHSVRVKVNLGLPFAGVETGIAADLGATNNFKDLKETGQLSFKYSPLQNIKFPVKVAAGVEQSGGRPVVFGMASMFWKRLGLRSLALEVAVGSGTTRLKPIFVSGVLRFQKQAALVAELEGRAIHAGFRILLSPSLRMDVFYLDLRTPLGDRPVRSVFSDRLRIGISKTIQMFGGQSD